MRRMQPKQFPLLCRSAVQVLNAAGAAGGHKPINMPANWLVQPGDQLVGGMGGAHNDGWFSRSVRCCVTGAAGRAVGWSMLIHDLYHAASMDRTGLINSAAVFSFEFHIRAFRSHSKRSQCLHGPDWVDQFCCRFLLRVPHPSFSIASNTY